MVAVSYGGVVVVTGFVIFTLFYGVAWSFGVFYIVFLEVFNESAAITSFVGALQITSMLLCGPAASISIQKLGNRFTIILGAVIGAAGLFCTSLLNENNIYPLLLTYGVITGCGFGFLAISTVVTINQYFDECRTQAYGFASIGIAFGIFVYPPVVRFLVERIGWRLTLQCVSLAVLSIVLLAFIITYETATKKKEKLSRTPQFSKKGICASLALFKNIRFVLFCISCMSYMSGYMVYNTFIIDHLVEKNMVATKQEGALVLPIVAAASITGRLVFMLVCLIPGVHFMTVYISCIAICSVCLAVLPFITKFTSLLVLLIIFGLGTSSYPMFYPPTAIAIVGEENVAGALGIMSLIAAFGNICIGSLGGYFHDVTGDYILSFMFSSGLYCICWTCLVYPLIYDRNTRKAFCLDKQNYSKKWESGKNCDQIATIGIASCPAGFKGKFLNGDRTVDENLNYCKS